jgi:hypothetical protein
MTRPARRPVVPLEHYGEARRLLRDKITGDIHFTGRRWTSAARERERWR